MNSYHISSSYSLFALTTSFTRDKPALSAMFFIISASVNETFNNILTVRVVEGVLLFQYPDVLPLLQAVSLLPFLNSIMNPINKISPSSHRRLQGNRGNDTPRNSIHHHEFLGVGNPLNAQKA